MAVEVEHIGLHGVLATKLDAHLAAAKEPPEHEFGVGLSLSKASCQVDEVGWGLFVWTVGV